MRHMLGNLSPNYFERTKRYMMLRASRQGTDLTVSGTPPLSLPNSLGKPLKAWEVALSPFQDLHGYDSPWPAGGGVNLANVARYTNVHGLTVNVATDGVITINGTATEASYIQGVFNCSDATAQYTLALFNTAASSGVEVSVRTSTDAFAGGWGVLNSVNKTITFTPSAEPAKWQIYVANGTALSNFIVKPMIVLGTTAPASFSPYSNICPISGTDKLNLFVEESYDQSATPKAVLTLPQTVYTGTIGSEGGESRDAKKAFDGSNDEDWVISSAWGKTNTTVFYISNVLTDALFTSYDNAFITHCNEFIPMSRNTLYNSDNIGVGYSGIFNPSIPSLTVRISKTIASTVGEFRAFLASNPLEIVYPTVTPTQFSITPPTIPTPTGTATTWATAEDGIVDGMEVTYVGKV